MHHPVLLREVIAALQVKPGGLYIDATFGQGGHSAEILRKGGKVLGIEWDKNQYQISNIKYRNYIAKTKNLVLINNNFIEIEAIAKKNDFFPVDGILFDLGLSAEQLNNSGRGFSYNKLDEPLDMRINAQIELNATDIIKSLSQDELYEILAGYSEEINSLAISQAIVRTRSLKKIERVGDLINLIDRVLRVKSTKTYARVFQALRIAVNNEFDNLTKALQRAIKIIKRNGRIVIITFHSLEDRIVKQFIKKNQLRQINRKVIRSQRKSGFERSAKLRIITR